MALYNPRPDRIKIVLYYTEKVSSGYTKINVLDDKKAQQMLASEDEAIKSSVKSLTTYWKAISWQEQNELNLTATEIDVVRDQEHFNFYKYRDLRLKKCLVEWDMKDDDGQAVPLLPPIIDSLDPKVVMALINKYDEIVLLNEDEEKK